MSISGIRGALSALEHDFQKLEHDLSGSGGSSSSVGSDIGAIGRDLGAIFRDLLQAERSRHGSNSPFGSSGDQPSPTSNASSDSNGPSSHSSSPSSYSSSPSPYSSTSSSGQPVSNSGSAQGILQQTAAQDGWGSGSEWQALANVENAEAGFNPTATNPSSGALGLAQALGHGNANTAGTLGNQYGGYGLTDAQAKAANSGNAADQALWMVNYIKATYGTPEAAWAHEQADHWY